MAFLAFPEGCTFSDKIAPADWPSFCQGILDSQADTVGRDKMMLGAQDNISRFSQHSYFSICCGFASKKGATNYPASSCCPLPSPLRKMSSQRMASHGNASAPTAHVVIL